MLSFERESGDYAQLGWVFVEIEQSASPASSDNKELPADSMFFLRGLEDWSIADLDVLMVEMASDQSRHKFRLVFIESRILEGKNINVLSLNITYKNEKFITI
jgi:hypothetical protein